MIPHHRRLAGRAATLLIAATLGLAATQARAASFQLREDNTVAQGTALAGAVSAADTPATAVANPAGLTELPGIQFYTGGALIAPSFKLTGSAHDALGRPIAGTSNDGGHAAVVPYTYASWRANDRLALALAVTVPFGLATYYGPDFIGRYQADKTQLTLLDVNPAVAYRITPWLSLGAGLSFQRASAEFASVLNASTIGLQTLGTLQPLPDGYFHLRSSGNWAFGYNAGALVRLDADTRLGLAYRSRVQHDFRGTAQIDVPYPLSLSPALTTGPAAAKLALPDTATASITHHFGARLTGYADVSWTNWSLYRSLDVYRTAGPLAGQPVSLTDQHYHDSVFAAVGAAYRLTQALTIRGGGAFDLSPAPSQPALRTARLPDGDRTQIAVGASWRVLPAVTLDMAYAHLFVNGVAIDQQSPTLDTITGRYRTRIDVVSLGVRTAM